MMAYKFVLNHINLGAEINGILRKDVYELPVKAIREMIANAVMHRSYLDDSCIQVCIYDDRIEVISPGMLYGGLDIETVKLGKSRCRNSAIAEAFQYMHIVENWGTGIPRIINRCKEYGLKEPLFEEFGDGFKVILYRKIEKVSSKEEKVSSKEEKVSSKEEKVSSKEEKVSSKEEKVSSNFQYYQKILKEAGVTSIFIANIEKVYNVYQNEVFRQSDIMKLLDCSKSKATNIMNTMKKGNIVERVSGLGRYRFIKCGLE